ncbi:MAG TPA: GTPase RsgA [Nocardioidaceae bacterium]|nr:GTPase RsgA [Nocardioidaceae bacterium]
MLEAIGYDRDLAQWAATADSRLGRVLRVERGLVTLLTESGEVRASYGGRLLGWIATDSTAGPCVGDWAVLRDWPDRRVTLERIVPRRTSVRGSVGEHVLAANVDLVAVVIAADTFDETLARTGPIVAMAESSGVRTLLVLARCDRVAELPVPESHDVLATSASTGHGLRELRGLVEQHLTLAMLAVPGQGKSALVRALVGDLAVRRAPKRMLHVLPSGGAVIDTPCLRAMA